MKRRKPKPHQREPLWDWTKGLTQSSISQFLSCREQFSLNYIEGWTTRSFSMPLEFGTLFHLCLQAQGLKLSPSFSPEKASREVCEAYRATRMPVLKDHESKVNLDRCLNMIEALFPAYYRHYRKDDAKQKWIARERKFQRDHRFGLTLSSGEVKFITVPLKGMRDGEYRTPDGLGLFETKTKSSIDDAAIQAGLRADLQTMFYLLAMKLEYKEAPREVLYNVVRRPALVYNPKQETLRDFRDRVREDIDARPQWYFKRWEVHVREEDIDNFVQFSLDPILRIMYQWWRSLEKNPFDRFKSQFHFVSLPALFTKYGRAPLYDLIVLKKQSAFFRRSSLFPELDES